jgi:hypothetical protein
MGMGIVETVLTDIQNFLGTDAPGLLLLSVFGLFVLGIVKLFRD